MTKGRFRIEYPIIIILAVIVFGNILQNKFVFDDMSTIVTNTVIKDFSRIPVLFSKAYFKPSGTGYFTISGEGSYRPVVTFSYFIDYAIWGLSGFGFHLTNLLLHLFTVMFFYIFAERIMQNRTYAFISAMLYAVHPLLTETVNCVSFREDILCALFFWITLALFQKPIQNRIINYLCIFISSIFCLFSKESGIILLPVLLLVDFFSVNSNRMSKNTNKFLSMEYACVGAVTVLYILTRFYIMKNPYEENIGYPGNRFSINIIVMQQVIARYIRLLFFPFGLTADYTEYFPKPLINRGYIIVSSLYGLFFIASVIAGLILSFKNRMRNKFSVPAVSMVLFFLSLVPVMNIIPIKNIIAERYLYLPFGFFALIVAGFLSSRKTPMQRPSLIVLTVSIIVLFSCLSITRNHNWSDGYHLWKSTLRVNPKSFHAHNNLASIYDEHGNLEKAMYHYKQAISMRPYDAIPYYNLANTLKNKGRFYDAITYYKKAIENQSSLVEPHVNIGLVYARLGNFDLAETHFRNAIRIQPNDANAHNNLGVVLGHKGKLDDAVREHQIALRLDPYNENAYLNLAICYIDMNNYNEAINVLNRLLKLNPQYAEAYYLAGKSFEALGDIKKAITQYKRTITINPKHSNAMEALKRVLNQL